MSGGMSCFLQTLEQHCEGFKPTWNNMGYTREQKDRWTRHRTSGTLCPWPLTLTAVEGLLVPKHRQNLHTQMDINQCMQTYTRHVHKTNTNTCQDLGSCSWCWHFGSDEVICVTLTLLRAHTHTHIYTRVCTYSFSANNDENATVFELQKILH